MRDIRERAMPRRGLAVLWFRYRRLDARLAPGRLWDLFLWLSCAGFVVVGGWAVVGLLANFEL